MCNLRLFQSIPMAVDDIDGSFVINTNVVRLYADDGPKALMEIMHGV
jgi:hypothetical protein